MKRTKLADRALPVYSRGEELTNTLTHLLGAVLGIAVLAACMRKAGSAWAAVGCAIYGASCITMFTISSVYHGMPGGMGKKVMQVIDHCTIYFLIAGTYTPILLSALRPVYPALAWGMLAFEWTLALAAAAVTAIDLKKYNVFSMCCYIGMGWAAIPFWRQIYKVMGEGGFQLLLWGGIAYTLGSVLYGLGSRRKWMHSAFHVFVVAGAALQALAVVRYSI